MITDERLRELRTVFDKQPYDFSSEVCQALDELLYRRSAGTDAAFVERWALRVRLVEQRAKLAISVLNGECDRSLED